MPTDPECGRGYLARQLHCKYGPRVASISDWLKGVYGGVKSMFNGNYGDDKNLQNRALRGVQLTDKNGAVQFQTVYPGHYMGRTQHIHGEMRNEKLTKRS